MANALSPSTSMSKVKYNPIILMYVDSEAKERRQDIASSDDTDYETLLIFYT